jgi:hypothetical protein
MNVIFIRFEVNNRMSESLINEEDKAKVEDEAEPTPLRHEGGLSQQEQTSIEQEPVPPDQESPSTKEEKYNETEIAKIREIFNTFVKTDAEKITKENVLEILTNLKCSKEEGNLI